MTFQLERAAIEYFLVTAWAGATPVGLDGQEFNPIADSIRMTIVNGDTVQGSIGRQNNNRIENVGLLQIQIFVERAKGSSAWRGYAETLQNLFFNLRLTDAGEIATTEEFIRFSPTDQHPYISAIISDIPFTIATLNAPFIRYSYK